MPDDRKQLVSPRQSRTLEAVRNAAGGFDVDAFHVMNERDDQLIQDEILNGPGSNKFVYKFDIGGTAVTGISVVGARHLAAHYGGLKHRMVATIQKVGDLFTFTSYPSEHGPMEVRCQRILELADDDDFYASVVEMQDIKTGNSIQIERREKRFEKKRNGELYERPNYATIAQSKAYRNAVLALVAQNVQIQWKEQMLALGKNDTLTESIIDEKRSKVIQYAAKISIPLLRDAVNNLTMDQIAGLSEAAHEGKAPAFAQSARALGLLEETGEQTQGEAQQQATPKADLQPKQETTKRTAKKTENKENPEPPAQGETVHQQQQEPTQQQEPSQTNADQRQLNQQTNANQAEQQKQTGAPPKLFS